MKRSFGSGFTLLELLLVKGWANKDVATFLGSFRLNK